MMGFLKKFFIVILIIRKYAFSLLMYDIYKKPILFYSGCIQFHEILLEIASLIGLRMCK